MSNVHVRQLELFDRVFDRSVDLNTVRRHRAHYGGPLKSVGLRAKMQEVQARARAVAAAARLAGGRNYLPPKASVGTIVWRYAWDLLLDTPPPLPKSTLRATAWPPHKGPPPFKGRRLKTWVDLG